MARKRPQRIERKTLQGAKLRTQDLGARSRSAKVERAASGLETSRSRGFLRAVLLVCLVAAVVYLNGLPGDFVFDDKLIQRDPRIHGQTSLWTIFVTDYWYKYIGTSADLYRPLTIASYALNYAAFGLSSPAFHLVNVLLHAACCAVLMALVEALFHDLGLATVAGLLFATHPVHTEAVTGIVGRAEILTAFFLLVALYLHCRRYVLWSRGRGFWLPVALAAYFCALLSKETAIVGPGLLILLDYVMQARDQRPAASGRLRRAAAEVGLYVCVAIIYVAIRYSVVGQFIQRPPPHSYLLLFGQPLMVRLCTALQILAIYLRLLILPVTLSADYSYRQVPMIGSLNPAAVVGLLAVVVLCAGFVSAVRRRAWPAVFALGFFAICYALVSNLLVPLQILVAERLMYLPSVGFCVGVAWLWGQWARRCAADSSPAWLRHAPAAVVAVVVLLYSARTFVRNFDWRDNETLYAATVRAAPECFAAHSNYAAILMRDGAKTQRALEELLTAYKIRQDHYPTLVNLSSAYMSLGQPEKAREIALHGLKIRPNGAELRQLLDAAEAQLRRRGQG